MDLTHGELMVLRNLAANRAGGAGIRDRSVAAMLIQSCALKGLIEYRNTGWELSLTGHIAVLSNKNVPDMPPQPPPAETVPTPTAKAPTKIDYCCVQDGLGERCSRGTLGCVASNH